MEAHTEAPRRGLLLNFVEENPQPVQRSTIERILTSLNSGGNAQEVLTTTAIPFAKPTSRFRGKNLVDELIQGFANGEDRNSRLTYDRQTGQWTYPDFFTVEYLQHAQEFRSEEMCTFFSFFL